LAVDPQVVGARLAALDQYLRFLDESARFDLSAFTSDPWKYAAAERFLHLAIESVLDIGTHCIVGLGLPRPSTYGDILPTLVEAGIVTAETARELASIAGFRNLLVHDYTRIDRARVHAFLTSRLDGFRRFAADIARYMTRT
jgi:uncharacterized protein YutE (UPF0331/DUF86 family)